MPDRPRWRGYLLEAQAATADEVEPMLWNATVGPADYDAAHEKYAQAILEQYKLYVEMADRVSVRRGLANTFFLTVNTTVFTTIGLLWSRQPEAPTVAALIPLLILLVQCFVWFWVVRSYRQLNSGKWAVVGALERRLPASPWWNAEWHALGEGKSPARYWPLTHVEQFVPALFALAYIAGFVAILSL